MVIYICIIVYIWLIFIFMNIIFVFCVIVFVRVGVNEVCGIIRIIFIIFVW